MHKKLSHPCIKHLIKFLLCFRIVDYMLIFLVKLHFCIRYSSDRYIVKKPKTSRHICYSLRKKCNLKSCFIRKGHYYLKIKINPAKFMCVFPTEIFYSPFPAFECFLKSLFLYQDRCLL
uniref:Uncharacterized protein n=1 Tax=Micrurus corallinus TaxID=54390 RepID=A0A2D4FQJ2_MICCO